MARDFKKFPEQYKVNLEFLKLQNDEFQTGFNNKWKSEWATSTHQVYIRRHMPHFKNCNTKLS